MCTVLYYIFLILTTVVYRFCSSPVSAEIVIMVIVAYTPIPLWCRSITCYSGDFLPISVYGYDNKGYSANGPPAIVETLCEEEGSLLILSKCRIKLYIEWIQRTSDDDKGGFLWGIRSTCIRLLWRDNDEKLSATWSTVPSTAIMVSMVLKSLETIYMDYAHHLL